MGGEKWHYAPLVLHSARPARGQFAVAGNPRIDRRRGGDLAVGGEAIMIVVHHPVCFLHILVITKELYRAVLEVNGSAAHG